MPSNSYIFPTTNTGFARSACLTSFSTNISGVVINPPTLISQTAQPIIGFVGSNSTIPAPTPTMQVGDLLLVYSIASSVDNAGGTNTNLATNGGWNLFPTVGTYSQLWWKIATGADVGTANFTFATNSGFNFCCMTVWRNVNPITPLGNVVTNHGSSGTNLPVAAMSGLPTNSTVALFANQDDAGSGGFNINQITAVPGSPYILGFNTDGTDGNHPPNSASAAMAYASAVTSISGTSFTQNNNGSHTSWVTMAVPILPANNSTALALATYEVDIFETEGIWTQSQGTMSSIPSTSGRYIDASTDGVSGYYILGSTGPLVHVSSLTSSPSSIALSTSPSFVYTGLTFNPTNSKPYIIGYDGSIYSITGNTQALVTGPPGGVTAPARQLYNDGVGNLWTSFPASNIVAKYSLSGATWTLTSSPFNSSLDTISYSTSVSALIAGGTNTTAVTDSSTILDINYAIGPDQLLVADNSPSVKVYNQTEGGWLFGQAVNGYTGIPTQIATEPDGDQALVTDLTNNQIEVLTYTGVWTQTSTVPLTGPTAIAIYTSGITQALVCQPSSNLVAILNKSVTNWITGQTPLAVTSPTTVAINQASGAAAIVATSTGVQFLNFGGALWTLGSAIALNPVPTFVATDAFATNNPLFYAAGVSGGVTTVYIFQGGVQVGSYTLTGTASGLEVINWQILVPTTTGTLNIGYYVNGVTNNTVNAAAIPTGTTVNMAWIPQSLEFFPSVAIAGPNSIWNFYNYAPQSFVRETDSSVAILSGGGNFTTKLEIQYGFMPLRSSSGTASGSWTLLDLINRNKISSITTDLSNNIYAVTVSNDFYKFTKTGLLASGYPFTVSPPTNQEEGITLGFSKLVVFNNQIAAASSMLGGILILTP